MRECCAVVNSVNRKGVNRNSVNRNIASKKRASIRKSSLIRLFLLIPAVVIVAFIFFKNGASGQDNMNEAKGAYYHELEHIYRDALDNALSRKGYSNAGVTITSIIDINGDRSYTVSIHHSKLSSMDEEERSLFLDEMSHISFTDGVSPIKYEIFL